MKNIFNFFFYNKLINTLGIIFYRVHLFSILSILYRVYIYIFIILIPFFIFLSYLYIFITLYKIFLLYISLVFFFSIIIFFLFKLDWSFHKYYKYSHFSIFIFFFISFFFFLWFLFFNTYKPYFLLPIYNYFFDFFSNFFPDCSFYYYKFYYIYKHSDMDILDEREYFFLFNDGLEVPYLKLVRYFDFYLGNFFGPLVPVYERHVRVPAKVFIYDIEEYLFFLKEHKDSKKLHEFTIKYTNKKLDFMVMIGRAYYQLNRHCEIYNLLDEFHKNLQFESLKKPTELQKNLKFYYLKFLRNFYYPVINDFFYAIYDYSGLAKFLSPINWYLHRSSVKTANMMRGLSACTFNYDLGKNLTHITEESGYRNVKTRPMRPKLEVSWREYVWPASAEKHCFLKYANVIKGDYRHLMYGEIDHKYDYEQNALLKKIRKKDQFFRREQYPFFIFKLLILIEWIMAFCFTSKN